MPSDDLPLMLEIRDDLARVDRVMSQVIADRTTAEEFVRDPSGVLTRLGMHARTTRDVHERTNRVFYAILTNTELLAFMAELFESFDAQEAREEDRVSVREALARGEIRHAASLDKAALDFVMDDIDVVRRAYQLTLHNLNERRVLMNTYTREEIDDFVERLATAIVEGRPISDMPLLEAWDGQYGVGARRQGVNAFEVGPIATAAAFVEVGLWATVWLGVGGDFYPEAQLEAIRPSARSEPGAIRTLATAGAIMNLAGEILLHATNFERQ